MTAFALMLALGLLLARTDASGTCGEKKRVAQQLISHGYKSLEGAWPWHGAMFHRYQRTSDYVCGVSVLTKQFLITAAHCTIDPHERQHIPARRVFVKVGLTNLKAPGRQVQQHDVDKIIRHEDYEIESFEDDIALLLLYTDIGYDEYVQPICLWQGDTKLSKIVSHVGYIVGWGIDESSELPTHLNEATMPIVSRKECIGSDSSHYSRFYFEPKTFCAGYRNGTQAAPGDSGGGLFLRVEQHWVLRGIVSTAKADRTLNAEKGSFVVFTDVSYYNDWIKAHITARQRYEFDSELLEIPMNSRPSGDSGNHANLLNITSCGKDTYPPGTPEEMKGYLNQYPWLAVIEYINISTQELKDGCHGILVHPSFLLTAGNCVHSKTHPNIDSRSVRLNDYRLDTVNDIFDLNGETISVTATRIPIGAVFVHPNFNNPKYTDNIALIKLKHPATANPICLPSKGSILPVNEHFTIVGWKRNSLEVKPMIRNVVQLADFEACRSKYAKRNASLDSTGGHLCCTYSHDDDSGNCSHYMGSAPLHYVRNGPLEGQYFLAAIGNFGNHKCWKPGYPDVLTNVAHFADWIMAVVTKN